MKEYINPTEENVQMILDKVAEYAKENKLVVTGDLKLNGTLTFPSNSQKKVLRNYVTRLDHKVTRSQANRFLHALKRYADFEGSLKLSSKELAIQKARKEWKDARDKAELLLKEYKETKGDFYK